MDRKRNDCLGWLPFGRYQLHPLNTGGKYCAQTGPTRIATLTPTATATTTPSATPTATPGMSPTTTLGQCVEDTWTATNISNAPTAREFHTAVWTGSEM